MSRGFRGMGFMLGRMSRGFPSMGCIFLYIRPHVTGFSMDADFNAFLYSWFHVTRFSRDGMHISIYLAACHGVFEACYAYFCILGRRPRGFRCVECKSLYFWSHVTGFLRHGIHAWSYVPGFSKHGMHISVY